MFVNHFSLISGPRHARTLHMHPIEKESFATNLTYTSPLLLPFQARQKNVQSTINSVGGWHSFGISYNIVTKKIAVVMDGKWHVTRSFTFKNTSFSRYFATLGINSSDGWSIPEFAQTSFVQTTLTTTQITTLLSK